MYSVVSPRYQHFCAFPFPFFSFSFPSKKKALLGCDGILLLCLINRGESMYHRCLRIIEAPFLSCFGYLPRLKFAELEGYETQALCRWLLLCVGNIVRFASMVCSHGRNPNVLT